MTRSINLTTAEEKLAERIWREVSLTSPELVSIAYKEMGWKKSTTYTVLKKLCDKGVFKNNNANISILLTKDELIAHQSRRFIEDTFGGSLPGFIASFFSGRKLTPEQAAELQRLIEEHVEDREKGDDHG